MISGALLAGMLIGFGVGQLAGLIIGAWWERKRLAAIQAQADAALFCAEKSNLYHMREQLPALLRRQAE